MGAGYGDGFLIVFHELSEKLCSGKDRQILRRCRRVLRVIRVDCRCIYNSVDIVSNVLRPLPVDDLCAVGGELIGELGFMGIGAAYCESSLQQDLSQSAHADSADSDKVNVFWFIKIDMIHRCLLSDV